jgi:hypothetical protein
MDSPAAGDREYEQDLNTKNQRYTYQSNVNDEAEERKRGGRAKKHVGKMHGSKAMSHAGRKPRKSGGRAGSDKSPLSSAHAGTPPRGHKDKEID